MLDAALEYASLNWHIVPLWEPAGPETCSCPNGSNPDPELRCSSVGKHPRTMHGLSDATTDVETITRWWTQWPKANIGVNCGKSGLIVVDVDPRHGGDEDWRDCQQRYGQDITATVTAITGGGGEHYVFTAPQGYSVGNISNSDRYVGPLGRGVDVRASGGYFVAPPSRHATGRRYEWDASPFDSKPARVPLPLLEVLSTPPSQNGNKEPISAARILEGVQEGGRDWALFQLASKLRYADVPIDMAYYLIEQAALNCKPPFPRAEARDKVNSAYKRYEPGAGAFIEANDATAPGLSEPIDWTTFWTTDHKAEDWLLEPVIPRGRSIALYAPAKAGKSLFALKMMVCLATGRTVLDQPGGDPVDVVYFDLEMTETDLYERLDEMGYGPDTDLSHLHYYLLPALPALDTPKGGAAVLEIVTKHAAKVVAIDTTSRVLGGPENDADTLRALYICTGLPLKAAGVTVIRLDHAGKNLELGQRGTSAKNDDVDLVWQLTVQDDGLKLKATHRRQSWIPEEIDLAILEGPLRYEQAMQTWSKGTKELAKALDDLGVPLDCKNKDARLALRNAGHQRKNAVMDEAVKYRRIMSPKSGIAAGIVHMFENGIEAGIEGDLDTGIARGSRGSESTANGDPFPYVIRDGPEPKTAGDIKRHRIFDKDEDWE